MITILRASPLHAREMAEILAEIIAKGGSTALVTPVTAADIQGWMARSPDRSVWHVAEDDTGRVMGYQWVEPNPDLPPEAADIATFARVGHTGLGIGSALFRATADATRELGYGWINANIRADNSGGLAYYQSRGFEDYGRIEGYVMADGQTVDKVLKRFDL